MKRRLPIYLIDFIWRMHRSREKHLPYTWQQLMELTREVWPGGGKEN